MENRGLINGGQTGWTSKVDWGTIGKGLAITAGLVTITQIPKVIDWACGIPDRMMERGYEFHARRGQQGGFEVDFGQEVFRNHPAEENDDDC